MKKWYEIKALAETAELLIYDVIGDWGISAKDFMADLKSVGDKPIDLRLNSPGGEVVAGFAVYNALRRHPKPVSVYVDGVAASMASLVAMAGQTISMAETSLLMIHNPWSYGVGDSDDLRKEADLLDKMADQMAAIYAERSGQTPAQIRAIMDAETWYTAEEAKEAGFCDVITEPIKAAAMLRQHDLSAFRHPPSALHSNTKPKTIPAPKANINKEGTMPDTNTATPTPPAQPTGAEPNTVNVVVNDRKAAAEIATMCAAHGFSDKAAGWIAAGLSPDQVASKILDAKTSAFVPQPPAEAIPQMIAQEKRKFSLAAAVKAIACGGKLEGFEAEVSTEIEKNAPVNYKRQGNGSNSFFMPLVTKRAATALDSKTASAASELVFDAPGEMIDMLRARSIILQLGARLYPGLNSPVTFPKRLTGVTGQWVQENPSSDVSETAPTWGTVSLSPKTIMATTATTRQLEQLSIIDVEQDLKEDLTLELARLWEVAAFHGTGSDNQPKGVYTATDVAVKAMGGAPTYGKLVDMQTEVMDTNVNGSRPGFATTVRMAGLLKQTLESSSAGAGWIWEGDHAKGVISGSPAFSSTNISRVLGSGANEHGLVFGYWDQLLIGMWGALEIIVDPYTVKKKAIVEITAFQMCDLAFRYGQAFCKATGATLS